MCHLRYGIITHFLFLHRVLDRVFTVSSTAQTVMQHRMFYHTECFAANCIEFRILTIVMQAREDFYILQLRAVVWQ